jgi:ABC-type bacteriocin/lantibiotic exporter with double-glycine peptidase domain
MFIMAGFDLLMGLADVAFLIALVFIIRVYTSNVPVSAVLNYYSMLANTNPVIVTGIFLLLFCLKNIAGVWLSKSQHGFVYGVASRLSGENIGSYLKGSYADFVNVDSSVRIRQIGQVPIEFSHYVLTNFQQIIAQGILIIFTITAILLYHPVLFVLLLLLLFPPVILLGWFIKGKLKSIRAQIKQSSARVIQYLQESLLGYVESNIYHKNSFFVNRYHQQQAQLNQTLAAQQTLQGMSSRFVEIFALLGFFILIVINKWFGGKATIDVLTIGIFMASAYKIIPGVVKILNSAGQMRTYSFTLHNLASKSTADKQEQVIVDLSIQNISFNNVGFKFKDSTIINNLSFEINLGDFAGISGISGRGKTTIVNLILGFLSENEGIISINNKAANAFQRQSYWNRVAYVKQQSFFINDTILKNITLSEDGYDQNNLKQALHISGLDVFLSEYPEGVHKMIYEHGKNISGGQRQRIALARALYHDFDLLILDEPFSEMDELAEQQILNRISNFKNDGKIVLLITHNKASLSFCNKTISPDAA